MRTEGAGLNGTWIENTMNEKGHHRHLGRNDPCHCGSGKKYKDCCLSADVDSAAEQAMEEASTKLQLRLNQGIAGGSYRRYLQGPLLWAGLRSAKGKEIPELPPQPLISPFLSAIKGMDRRARLFWIVAAGIGFFILTALIFLVEFIR